MNKNKLVRPIRFKKFNILPYVALVLIFLALFSAYSHYSTTLSPTIVAFKSPESSYSLPAAKWVPQTFNNCGPAATAMVLQYFGYNVSQEETKAHLRTNPDDKNVFISEISSYIKQDYNVDNKVFFNGNIQTIKTLVANGIPVVVEDFLHPNEDIGHVLIIRGYDDAQGVLIADDSYFGIGQKYSYSTWDETQWKPYNREYMPVYTSDKENLVKSIVGADWDQTIMYQNSVSTNLADTKINSNDMYAWFNLGMGYYHLGRYEEAKAAFEKSESIGWPHRMLWYFQEPVENYNKLGDYQKAIDTANLGLWYNDNYAEMHYQKYIAYKGLGNEQNAQIELTKAKDLDPSITLK